jgi:hypothetical protein
LTFEILNDIVWANSEIERCISYIEFKPDRNEIDKYGAGEVSLTEQKLNKTKWIHIPDKEVP